MKVFISWSGPLSQSIARALRTWLLTVVQHVDPWMSGEEIKSGTRWNDQVAKALEETNYGIVCVTASNQHQPWLMFEAGALAKHLEVGHIVPLCIDLAPAEITGPLAAFQGRRLDGQDMRRLVQDMMALREKPPDQPQIDEIFRAMWPALESRVNEAKRQFPNLKKGSPDPDPDRSRRSPEEMLQELVERVRRIDRLQGQNDPAFVASGFGTRDLAPVVKRRGTRDHVVGEED